MKADEKKIVALLEKRKGKTRLFIYPPFRKKVKVKFIDYDYHQQSTYKDKYFALELLRYVEKGKEEIRIGYYIKGKKTKMKGKWTWGQFCPTIPKNDLQEVLTKALDLIYHKKK